MQMWQMKKLNILILVAILLLSASVLVEAAIWEIAGETPTKTIYVDVDSVSGDTNGPIDVMVKYAYKAKDCSAPLAQQMSKCIVSTINNERYFSNKSVCHIQVEVYFSDGTNYTSKQPCVPMKFPPASVGDVIWNHLYQ